MNSYWLNHWSTITVFRSKRLTAVNSMKMRICLFYLIFDGNKFSSIFMHWFGVCILSVSFLAGRYVIKDAKIVENGLIFFTIHKLVVNHYYDQFWRCTLYPLCMCVVFTSMWIWNGAPCAHNCLCCNAHNFFAWSKKFTRSIKIYSPRC